MTRVDDRGSSRAKPLAFHSWNNREDSGDDPITAFILVYFPLIIDTKKRKLSTNPSRSFKYEKMTGV